MNRNFMNIRELDGELKISHKKTDFGVTVSTQELVFQKPHVNYYIKLEQISGIVPFETTGLKAFTIANRRSSGNEVTHLSFGTEHYRIYVQEAVVHNRCGMFRIANAQFILPLYRDLLRVISENGGMQQIATV